VTNKLLITVSAPSKDPTLDGFSNSFTFETSDVPPYGNVGVAFTALEAFYNTVATGASQYLATYLAPSMDNGAGHSSMTAYDITSHLDGTPHGAPVALHSWTCNSPGSAAGGRCVPEGTCIVLSFRGDYGTDVEFAPGARPRSRDRGRIYFGPASQNCLQFDATTSRTEVSAPFTTDSLAAMFALSATHSSGAVSYNWRQWSRKDAAVHLITELYLDDRPDYQRRRTDPDPGKRTYRVASSA